MEFGSGHVLQAGDQTETNKYFINDIHNLHLAHNIWLIEFKNPSHNLSSTSSLLPRTTLSKGQNRLSCTTDLTLSYKARKWKKIKRENYPVETM
jgi:hypothetical protein